MASIKVKFRPSTVADHEGTIYYQIIHERKPRQLLSDYHVFPSEWDPNRSMVTTTQKSERKSFILSVRERIRCDVERLTRIIRQFENNGIVYSADDVLDEFKRYTSQYSLSNFMEEIIIKFRQNGKIRTSETYLSTLNSFHKFLCDSKLQGQLLIDENIMLDCLSSELMESYEAWLKLRGLSPNTTSFYTRILRAVYNRAVDDNIIENRNPFRHVYTGVGKTVKRALPLTVIKKIKNLELGFNAHLDYARDLFMLSFMLRGMSFVDMAYLKKSDIKHHHVIYRRRKTGQRLAIEWTGDMQAILDKYPENSSEYLLPIIKETGIDERITIRNTSYKINYSLKKIGRILGVKIPLTLYVARHSWASAANSKGIPLSVISAGMGHDSESTTKIYLASLDTAVVDKANSLILSSLKI